MFNYLDVKFNVKQWYYQSLYHESTARLSICANFFLKIKTSIARRMTITHQLSDVIDYIDWRFWSNIIKMLMLYVCVIAWDSATIGLPPLSKWTMTLIISKLFVTLWWCHCWTTWAYLLGICSKWCNTSLSPSYKL